MHREKVWRDVNALAARLADLRAEGARVVTANGCFELLHVGHVRYLEEARELGDLLVVLVNTDASMARIKPDRELVVHGADRMELVAALEAVDFVAPLDDDTPAGILDLIQPAVHTKGTDYAAADLPERVVVERHGGRIAIVGGPKNRSTTDLRRKLGET
ncbi:MAG: adenylyltransferase/cytidyltransferase family protein [Planctomycetota bacterium]|jgi:D-beta-D-heptose 7-phosphate kinase/D-beta-D-heptose 1-phosphate adenosyltransferase